MPKIKQIYLSASQQPNNHYTGAQFTEEESMHIFVRDHLAPKLIDKGYDVKTSDPKGTMESNVAEANAWMGRGGMYLAWHTNASGTGKNDGTLVLVYPSVKSHIIGECLYNEIAPATPSSDEGIRENPSLYELRKTLSPAVLTEIFYHDNLADVKWGLTHFDQIAEAAANAIDKAVDILAAA